MICNAKRAAPDYGRTATTISFQSPFSPRFFDWNAPQYAIRRHPPLRFPVNRPRLVAWAQSHAFQLGVRYDVRRVIEIPLAQIAQNRLRALPRFPPLFHVNFVAHGRLGGHALRVVIGIARLKRRLRVRRNMRSDRRTPL
ncbi:MAG: hypothetical protein LBL45_11075 [Treponema sp.]|nr:hypothetical protein [Treponema sp.]